MPFTQAQLTIVEAAIKHYANDPERTSATPLADLVTMTAAARRTALLPYVQEIQATYQGQQTRLGAKQTAETSTVNQLVTDAAAVVGGL